MLSAHQRDICTGAILALAGVGLGAVVGGVAWGGRWLWGRR